MPDHPKELPHHIQVPKEEVIGPLLRVTKEWMALWPVDHAAQVDTSESPRTAPTCRLGSVT